MLNQLHATTVYAQYGLRTSARPTLPRITRTGRQFATPSTLACPSHGEHVATSDGLLEIDGLAHPLFFSRFPPPRESEWRRSRRYGRARFRVIQPDASVFRSCQFNLPSSPAASMAVAYACLARPGPRQRGSVKVGRMLGKWQLDIVTFVDPSPFRKVLSHWPASVANLHRRHPCRRAGHRGAVRGAAVSVFRPIQGPT